LKIQGVFTNAQRIQLFADEQYSTNSVPCGIILNYFYLFIISFPTYFGLCSAIIRENIRMRLS